MSWAILSSAPARLLKRLSTRYMTAFGLGPVPGTDIALAADIIAGEYGDNFHLPKLPTRGLGSDAFVRTAGLMDTVTFDRGPIICRWYESHTYASHSM